MPSRLSRPQSTSETDVTLLVEDDRGQDFLQLLTGKRSSRHLNRQGECQFQASETSIMSLPSLGRAQNFLSNGSCSSQILSERKVRLLEFVSGLEHISDYISKRQQEDGLGFKVRMHLEPTQQALPRKHKGTSAYLPHESPRLAPRPSCSASDSEQQ